MLKDVPKILPALMRSYKVQQKAAQVGFDWDDIEDVFRKVEEEIIELRDVYKSNNVERITDELGDAFLLSSTLPDFSMCSLNWLLTEPSANS